MTSGVDDAERCNRRALLANLDARLVARQPGPVSALFFDLGRLKTINDYLGHIAGDWFIRVLADRLREGAEGPNLALAEAFGLQLVAEGVETEKAAVTLLRHENYRAARIPVVPPSRRRHDGGPTGRWTDTC